MPGLPVDTSKPSWEEILRRRVVLSPLRYPGGKRRLVPYLVATLLENELRPDLFLEPYAGGASVALELAHLDLVETVGLVDNDPWVAAFWETVFSDSDWLCEQIAEARVTLEEWRRCKELRGGDRRARAWACLFLNRTSFNGALHRNAGPIGGQAQSSAYGLDCRFPRERLIARVRACRKLADAGKVAFVRCEPALAAVRSSRSLARIDGTGLFLYLDPPFWAKSQMLYRRSFTRSDHEELAEELRRVTEPWLLSYDPAMEITLLYREHGVRMAKVDLSYSASGRSAGRELVISPLRLPGDSRLWSTAEEWDAERRRPV